MSTGTSSVSGVSSGIDWRNIIDQLTEVEHKPIDLLEARKTTYQERLSAWQSINSKLLSLKTVAGTLNSTTDFNVYIASLSSNTTTDAEDILSATTSTDASPGTYNIVVKALAAAQKLSSRSYASQTTELGLSGDMVVGGRTVKIAATDTLSSLRDKINAVNTGTSASGVSASIVDYGISGYRLILTSDEEGAEGMTILNGGASDLLETLGFVDASAKTAKNAFSGGHMSGTFDAADEAIGGSELLDLTSAESGTVTITINGTAQDVAIDLSSDSLNDIRDAINTAFGGMFASDPASVVSETVDGTTRYQLLIEGNTISYTDANNVLETLGVVERAGVTDEQGVTGDVANTSSGLAITSSTRFDDIDGYINCGSGDTIAFSGTDTSGNAVSFSFAINNGDYRTVGDLLAEIENQYGDVTASVTADGKIQVVDNEIGDDQLQVVLTPSNSGLSFDSDPDYDFGSISTIRARQVQAGADAEITVDGVTVHPTSNTVDDVITGVTLNLKKIASDTTATLTVGRDYDAVKEKIQELVTAYNEVMDAINAQFSYDVENEEPGGPLFGDSSLRTMKSNLTGIILNKVGGVGDDFSTPGLVGISIGTDSQLTIDDTTLQGYLETNFDDVKKLFVADWSSTNSHLSYIYHNIDTQAGTYDIHIASVDPVDGYFVASGDGSGSGEYLTGVSGDADGLVVRYSGTATGDAGSFTLTFGVAELFDRALYHLTDSVDGYMANKEEAIQDTIDNLDKRIEAMEERVDRKMARMTNQFIAMEMALSAMQSQSDWLSGQINASYSGWGW
jgi:flagellar hook-associated protein 2